MFLIALMAVRQPTLNNTRHVNSVKHLAQKVQTVVPVQAEKPQTVEPAATPEPQVVETPPAPTYTAGSHEDWMTQAGISPSDFTYVDYIVTHESTWGVFATEPTTGAYGLCQSLPATKMASAGSDWLTNPITQLSWCNNYAQSAYGGWASAYYHWINFRWW